MKAIIAVVEGDKHTVGKDLAKDDMKKNSIEVFDLGVNVPVDVIIQAMKVYKTNNIVLTAGMTKSNKMVAATIDKIRMEDRNSFIVFGGQFVTGELAASVGADAFAETIEDVSKLIIENFKSA